MARLALILLLAAVWGVAPAYAAPDSTGQPQTTLVRALGRIPAASMIRVQGSNLGLLEGTLERWDVQSLKLGEPTGEREIPLSSVQALWVRGRATGHGAKVGAIIAGIVGAVAGAATVAFGRGIAEGGGPDGLRGNYLGMAAVGGLAGGGIGALAGAGVGMTSLRWNRRFQHER